MGIHVIKMPDIGEGIAEVELVAWNVKLGDSVAEDQPLADVMTDKATVEIPSPVVGKVLALGGRPGQMMAVGSELIRIEVDGTGNADAAPSAVAVRTPPPSAQPVASAAAPPAPSPEPAAVAKPVSKGTVATAAQPMVRQPGDKPIASPAVRRRAWDMGIELRYVAGSGTAGRITRADLDAYATRAGTPAKSYATRAGDAEWHDDETVPVIGLRR